MVGLCGGFTTLLVNMPEGCRVSMEPVRIMLQKPGKEKN
jgi:hypothetical protein